MRKLSPSLPLYALAWARSRGRVTWLVVLVIAIATTAVVAALGVHLAKSPATQARDALGEVLLLHARAVLWGPGFVAVVGATLHAWRRDREEGVVALVQSSGYSLKSWVMARTVVLGAWLLALWAGSTVVVSLVVLGANPSMAHGWFAGLVPAAVFAISQSAVLALLGSVCLGPRSRPGGYLLLALILFVPEAVAGWTRPLVGPDLTSLPSLAMGLANAARPASFDAGRLLGCGVALGLVLMVLVAWARRASGKIVEARP